MSRPTISKAKTSYPIFAATFANNRPGVLVVGGGGGAGRTGVKNQITAFDFSSRAPTVESIAEIEASKDDSITCLENLSTKDGVILFAGNNSSEEDRLAGKNEHLRAFELRFPKGKTAGSSAEKADGNIEFLSKTTLLTTPQSDGAKKEGYQRIIRLSPPPRTTTSAPNKRIGAIASGLAGDENEVVVFNATSTKPANQDVIERIKLQKGQEANDVDIFTQGEGRFRVAYVTDQDVFVQEVNYDFEQRKTKGKNEHRRVYTIPHVEKGGRSKLRCIRWLSPKHLLLLANKPNRSGVELLLFHFYQDGGSLALRKVLPKHVKAATDMDVSLLDTDDQGAYQVVVAIAAIDMSLTVYTMDYHGPAKDSLSSFHSFNSYDNVHDFQMTKVVFSPFYKPEAPNGRQPSTQYLRLASTSLGNTISVETFTLQNIGSRHVVQTARSRNLFTAATYLVAAMVVAVIALLLQSLVDPEGNLTKSILPAGLQNAAGQHKTFGETLRDKRHQAALNNADSPVMKASQRIADLLHIHLPHVLSENKESAEAPSEPKALVIHHDAESDGTLSTEVHAGDEEVLKKHAAARRWDELSKEEKHIWREKLSEAGMWAVGEGETILKSIFFGQLGGMVGHAAQGVLGG